MRMVISKDIPAREIKPMFNYTGKKISIKSEKKKKKYLPDSLIKHRKEGTKSAKACEIHDMFLLHGVFQTSHNQAIWGEVGLKNCADISLNLDHRKEREGYN